MEMTKTEKIKAKIILSIGDWVDTPARTIPFERMIDALINNVKEECAKKCDNNIFQITDRTMPRLLVITMNPRDAYNQANKDNAKAIRDKK